MAHYSESIRVDFDRAILVEPTKSPFQGLLPISCAQSGVLLAVSDFILVILLNLGAQAIWHPVVTAHLGARHGGLMTSLTAVLYCLFMEVQDQYSCVGRDDADRVVWRPMLSWLAVFITVASIIFFAKVGNETSRVMVSALFCAGLVALPLWRKAGQSIISYLADHNVFAIKTRAVVLSLAGAPVEFGACQARGLRRLGKVVVSHLQMDQFDVSAVNRLKLMLSRNKVDEIYFACPLETTVLSDVSDMLKAFPLPVFWLADETYSALLAKPSESVGSLKALRLQGGPLTATQQLSKRLLDISCSAAGIVLLMPLLVLIAVAVKLDSPGPAIFKQRRSGFNGRTFRIYKFRSMSTIEDGVAILQATRGDKRITRVGGFLRRSSLDELPQLFNVLRGDMSLVGPRPHALCHDTQYGETIASYALRYHVKPGITGWAQVNGCRGETRTDFDMERRIALDIWYIKNWSFWVDVKAILGTLKQFAGTPNAY